MDPCNAHEEWISLCDFSDPCMTLEEWKLKIIELIEEYGKDSYLATDAGHNNVEMMLAKKTDS